METKINENPQTDVKENNIKQTQETNATNTDTMNNKIENDIQALNKDNIEKDKNNLIFFNDDIQIALRKIENTFFIAIKYLLTILYFALVGFLLIIYVIYIFYYDIMNIILITFTLGITIFLLQFIFKFTLNYMEKTFIKT